MRSSLGSRKATWIWDKVSGKEAWLVTRVGEGIKGVTSMNIGDVADFDSTVSSLGDGKWVSEPLGELDMLGSSSWLVRRVPLLGRCWWASQRALPLTGSWCSAVGRGKRWWELC